MFLNVSVARQGELSEVRGVKPEATCIHTHTYTFRDFKGEIHSFPWTGHMT